MNEQLDLATAAPEAAAAIAALSAADVRRRELEKRAPRGFNPAALFLLDLAPWNLYDPTTSDQWFTCRGCGGRVNRRRRRDHHQAHRRTYDSRR